VNSTFRYPPKLTIASYTLLARRLKRRNYDLGICLDRSPLVSGLMLLAGIPIRAGIDSSGRGVGLTHRVDPERYSHESELYLAVAESIGAKPHGVQPEYHPTEKGCQRAKELLSTLTEPIVVIHPGGAVNPGTQMLSKRWPAIMFGELASSLIEECQASVVVIGAESDRDAVQTTIDFTDGTVTNLSRRLSIDEVAAVCKHAQLYVGNDSGMSHLASSVGTATVTIFGPTSAEQYRPLGPRAEVCAPHSAGSSKMPFDLRVWQNHVDPENEISTVEVADVLATCARALRSDTEASQL
jgi:ADP-heptose:LPS heptosyltransferase